ncbi:hypothetical protein RHMOL_Rhmol05G0198100 [Rhododendron molle]|uniref:Uncharacterized protein n=1 Tax=Rhododendron molle TaxID=49168 RepID=A0ACC0NR54_RHOML|nr:hypothetical protein RHMOL_Rhmol05G0198100 [Rhododendron molle]
MDDDEDDGGCGWRWANGDKGRGGGGRWVAVVANFSFLHENWVVDDEDLELIMIFDAVLALKSLKSGWTNTPPNWVGSDPCGGSWEGISCTNSRVTSLKLGGTNLNGYFSNDITSLSALQYL